MKPEPSTERGWYNLLATQSVESMGWKAQFDRDYETIRTYVRDAGGLKKCAALCAEYALQGGITKGFFDGLNTVHPRALLLLAKYGVEFRSYSWDPGAEPTSGACYGNALVQLIIFNQEMRRKKQEARMQYVEGIAFSARTSAVLHAWNARDDFESTALDWTWYAVAGWSFYLGIPLTQRQHATLRKLAYPKDGFHLLLKEEVFPSIEESLTCMLEKQ